MARAYARTHGLNVSITRCCNNYGPYQYPEKVIPLFVTNLLEGRQVPLYGDGGNVRGWIHVDDHCRGIQLVLEHGERGGIYHINGDVELTNRELTAAILEACGADWDMVTMVEDRKGHDRRYSLDDSVLRAAGYAPRIPFAAGLRSTVQWYVDNREWWEPLKALWRRTKSARPCLAHRARSRTKADLRDERMARHRRRRNARPGPGQLRLEREGEDVAGYGRSELDITDAAAVRATLAPA